MIKGISTAKKTNKNQGVDIENACISCKDLWILIEVTRIPFRPLLDRLLPTVSSWRTVWPIKLSWVTFQNPVCHHDERFATQKWYQKPVLGKWKDNHLVPRRTSICFLKEGKNMKRETTLLPSGNCKLWRLAQFIPLTSFEEILQAELNYNDGFLFWYL